MPSAASFKRLQPGNRSLSRRAQRAAKTVEPWHYRFGLTLTRACLPTIEAIVVAVAIGVLAVVLTEITRLLVVPSIRDSEAQDVLLTLWQIQAAAAGVALPVLLFVIEVSRGTLAGGTRTHEVLLRRTLVLPILASAILGSIVIGVYAIAARPSTVLVPQFVFVFLTTMLGTLYAFYQVVKLTFSESALQAAAIALMREKMRLSVDHSAVRRVANALLHERVLPALKLFKLDPFAPDEGDDTFVIIRSQQTGTLVDLSPIRLEDLSRRFLLAQETPTLNATAGDQLATARPVADQPSPPFVWWMRLIGDRLKAGRTPLVAFDRRQFPQLDADAVAARVNGIITVAERDESESLQSELGYLRDVVIDAIRSGHARLVENRLELHEELIREFLHSLRRWDAAYDADSTAKEDSTPFRRFSWSELGWLEDDYREFADAAVLQEDVKLSRLVSGSAYSLALYAIGEAEYYVCSHAVDLMTLPYRAALLNSAKVPAGHVTAIASATAFMLGEMCRLRLSHDVIHTSDRERMVFARECGAKVLRALGQLAKEASDRGHEEAFRDFIESLHSGFQRVERPLPAVRIDPGDRDDPNVHRFEIARELQQERRAVALGLCAWLLRRYVKGDLPAPQLLPQLERLLADLGDVPALWELALHSTEHKVDERMGWSNWVLFDKANVGRGMFLDTGTYLWRAFFIAAIRQLGNAPQQVTFAPSEAARDATAVMDGDFRRILAEIRADANYLWQPLLNGIDRNAAIATIENAATNAAAAQASVDVDQLIDAPLSDTTIARVTAEILEGWTRNQGLRRLVESAGAYEASDQPAPARSHFGIWKLDRKDVYAVNTRLHSDGWGDSLGRGLANGENALVVNRMLGAATAAAASDGEHLATALQQAIAPLKNAHGDEHLVILLVSASRVAWQLASAPGFTRSRDDDHFAIGMLEGVRVFEIYIDDVESVALVVSLKAIGRWTRYAPSRRLDTEREIAPGLSFGVALLGAVDAQRMLEQDPSLMGRLGADSTAAAVRELRQSVSLRLMEAFTYEILNAEAATRIPLPSED